MPVYQDDSGNPVAALGRGDIALAVAGDPPREVLLVNLLPYPGPKPLGAYVAELAGKSTAELAPAVRLRFETAAALRLFIAVCRDLLDRMENPRPGRPGHPGKEPE